MNNTEFKVKQQAFSQLPPNLYIPPEALKVFLEMFEGPLDLLLYLIRKQNLNILEIPIAQITEQYIHYINAMQTLNIDLAAEYLLMAAVLIEIKSRILLPRPSELISEDPDANLDPRQELIQRLLEYEKIKQASLLINELPRAYRDYLWVEVPRAENNPTPPLVAAHDLHKAWQNILLRGLTVPTQHQIKKQQLSLREQMSQIMQRLRHGRKTNFYNLFEVKLGVVHLVVTFIAILELTKEGLVCIEQSHQQIFIDLVTNNE